MFLLLFGTPLGEVKETLSLWIVRQQLGMGYGYYNGHLMGDKYRKTEGGVSGILVFVPVWIFG